MKRTKLFKIFTFLVTIILTFLFNVQVNFNYFYGSASQNGHFIQLGASEAWADTLISTLSQDSPATGGTTNIDAVVSLEGSCNSLIARDYSGNSVTHDLSSMLVEADYIWIIKYYENFGAGYSAATISFTYNKNTSAFSNVYLISTDRYGTQLDGDITGQQYSSNQILMRSYHTNTGFGTSITSSIYLRNITPTIFVTSPSSNDTLLHNILERERSE